MKSWFILKLNVFIPILFVLTAYLKKIQYLILPRGGLPTGCYVWPRYISVTGFSTLSKRSATIGWREAKKISQKLHRRSPEITLHGFIVNTQQSANFSKFSYDGQWAIDYHMDTAHLFCSHGLLLPTSYWSRCLNEWGWGSMRMLQADRRWAYHRTTSEPPGSAVTPTAVAAMISLGVVLPKMVIHNL